MPRADLVVGRDRHFFAEHNAPQHRVQLTVAEMVGATQEYAVLCEGDNYTPQDAADGSFGRLLGWRKRHAVGSQPIEVGRRQRCFDRDDMSEKLLGGVVWQIVDAGRVDLAAREAPHFFLQLLETFVLRQVRLLLSLLRSTILAINESGAISRKSLLGTRVLSLESRYTGRRSCVRHTSCV